MAAQKFAVPLGGGVPAGILYTAVITAQVHREQLAAVRAVGDKLGAQVFVLHLQKLRAGIPGRAHIEQCAQQLLLPGGIVRDGQLPVFGGFCQQAAEQKRRRSVWVIERPPLRYQTAKRPENSVSKAICTKRESELVGRVAGEVGNGAVSILQDYCIGCAGHLGVPRLTRP